MNFDLVRSIAVLLLVIGPIQVRAADATAKIIEYLEHQRIISLTEWPIENASPFMVVTSSPPANAADVRISLRVLRIHDEAIEELADFRPGAFPLSQFVTTDDGGLLIATWGTGSAYLIQVLHYDKSSGRIQEILQEGSRSMPELIYPRLAGCERCVALILRDQPSYGSKVSAITYFFSDGALKHKTHTAWENRFRHLQ